MGILPGKHSTSSLLHSFTENQNDPVYSTLTTYNLSCLVSCREVAWRACILVWVCDCVCVCCRGAFINLHLFIIYNSSSFMWCVRCAILDRCLRLRVCCFQIVAYRRWPDRKLELLEAKMHRSDVGRGRCPFVVHHFSDSRARIGVAVPWSMKIGLQRPDIVWMSKQIMNHPVADWCATTVTYDIGREPRASINYTFILFYFFFVSLSVSFQSVDLTDSHSSWRIRFFARTRGIAVRWTCRCEKSRASKIQFLHVRIRFGAGQIRIAAWICTAHCTNLFAGHRRSAHWTKCNR